MCDEFIYYAIIIMKWCLPVANSYDDNGANILCMYISYTILIIEGGHSPSYKRARDELIHFMTFCTFLPFLKILHFFSVFVCYLLKIATLSQAFCLWVNRRVIFGSKNTIWVKWKKCILASDSFGAFLY